MPPRKKAPPAAQKVPVKLFSFHLSLSGIAGIALATFCLFLWMFFLGMWAGRTIVSPCPSALAGKQAHLETDSPAICVQPRERKKRISSGESSLYQGP
ncbi:MAG: hypothetical protein D3925_08390 [Candidatus Electrothrix sp. AR5]|nr:hypothetical protein [Candidatus Electrothrix sp. AR5]